MKLVILLLLLLTSCGQQKETPKGPPQPSKSVFKQVDGTGEKCIDGASYELKYGGAFLRFKDGRYVTC